MTDASSMLPEGFTPSEELVFAKAECKECGLKRFEDARAWVHQHVRETGHAIQLYFGYDVRDENWLERLPYERVAEIEALRKNPELARELASKLQRDTKRSCSQ